MHRLNESIQIMTPVERVFAFVADPKRTPEWVPSIVTVTNLQGYGEGSTHDWVFKMAGVPMMGHSRVTSFTPNEIVQVHTGGMVDSVWTYVFETNDDGTRLHMSISYTIPDEISVLMAGDLLQRVHSRELNFALATVKDICEHAAKETRAA